MMSRFGTAITIEGSTGLPAYDDILETREKCHSNQVSLYRMMFGIRRSLFGPQNCHCNVCNRGVIVIVCDIVRALNI